MRDFVDLFSYPKNICQPQLGCVKALKISGQKRQWSSFNKPMILLSECLFLLKKKDAEAILAQVLFGSNLELPKGLKISSAMDTNSYLYLVRCYV